MESDVKKEREKAKPCHVLGKSVIEEIQKDMENSVLLLSLIRAPLDWGTMCRGKLSVDQWRIICTIHLPIMLVRLWGLSLMVKNFMDLYKAMETAQNCIISKEHVTSYENHIVKYLKGVNHLYKDFTMKPIHHMAQHLGEFML
ncbi:hypothetical protein EDD18DRAFT_1080918 [Armillaria luteobubalina]|uniref:Uncharacterized protein n=1 Tax=Armillaria luteobubalina TaxID=153913 RepID=A0AA39PSQ3_9AGAR|nr:hypothetical protein EDD18DRAFT_1080918 [Armillaria luteobubalina]